MSNSDAPKHELVLQTVLPHTIPKLKPNFGIVIIERPEIEQGEEWPGNSYDGDGEPMFPPSIFPDLSFIGPVPLYTSGLSEFSTKVGNYQRRCARSFRGGFFA